MTDEIRAYDMGRFQRLVGVESPRVTGMFRVLSMKDEREESLVWPIEMTIWMGPKSDRRNWGRTYGPDDFSAIVKHGEVNLDPEQVPKDKRAEVEDALDDVKAAILAAANGAAYQDEQLAVAPAVPTEEQTP